MVAYLALASLGSTKHLGQPHSALNQLNGTLSDQKPSNAATSKHQLLTARHSQALRRKAPSSIFTGIIELLL